VHWRKLGRVYVPEGRSAWAKTHAMLPTPFVLDDDRIRVFMASCDEDMVGRVGYVDVDARNPLRVLKVAENPVLDIGEPGCFDDNGVNPVTVLRVGNEIRMYYVGYQLTPRVRYLLFSGLAVSRDGGESFERYKRVPVLDRTDAEPLVRTAPYVLATASGYDLWYIAGERFIQVGDRLRPTYDLRYMRSGDGITWGEEGEVVMPLEGDAYGYGRPFVLRDNGAFRMWYSIRTAAKGYRLGYAESSNGKTWTRLDHLAGLDVSEDGWDSQMVCYCSVVRTREAWIMFYNGNDYGRTGFGAAVMDGNGL